MARQFDRRYSLSITTASGESRIITDLRISFEITKSVLSFPNLAMIKVYNPNPDTIAALQDRFTRITLNAGYENNTRLIFTGDVRNVFESKPNVDRFIVIYAGDGERDWQNAAINRTFSSGISVNEVIREVVNTFPNVGIGDLSGIPENAQTVRGQTLSGSSKDVLEMFARQYNFDWSIQDNEIVINPVDATLPGRESILVSAQTGMLGTPTVTEIGADVKTFLNPELLPNRLFTISSSNAEVQLANLFFRDVPRTSAEGNYKVIEVVFRGDSREGDWVSLAKGRTI